MPHRISGNICFVVRGGSIILDSGELSNPHIFISSGMVRFIYFKALIISIAIKSLAHTKASGMKEVLLFWKIIILDYYMKNRQFLIYNNLYTVYDASALRGDNHSSAHKTNGSEGNRQQTRFFCIHFIEKGSFGMLSYNFPYIKYQILIFVHVCLQRYL